MRIECTDFKMSKTVSYKKIGDNLFRVYVKMIDVEYIDGRKETFYFYKKEDLEKLVRYHHVGDGYLESSIIGLIEYPFQYNILKTTYYRQFVQPGVELGALDISKVRLHEYDDISMWFEGNGLKWIEFSLFGKLGHKFRKADKLEVDKPQDQ